MTSFVKQKSIAQLPPIVKIFPLSEIVLIPQTQLPLNIFEKKFIHMIDDALKTDRLIGFIQPKSELDERELHQVGCIGRITSFQEASKGQYQITLLGLCRFKVLKEVQHDSISGNDVYREAYVDYEGFDSDFDKPSKTSQDKIDRKSLLNAIKDMLARLNLEVEWDHLDETPNEMLVNAIAMTSPFNNAEKQALLEARNAQERAELLILLSKMTNVDFDDDHDIVQ